MNTPTNDGGPAFPVPPGTVSFTGDPRDGAGYEPSQGGMTLRDYFAGQWLAGLGGAPDLKTVNRKSIADDCYKMADAMLAERIRA